MSDSVESVIHDIMQQYPEQEWLDRCRKALPELSDGDILNAIEIFSGGDVDQVDG
jgi:HD superfamily phosphohydrolase YqeK